MISFNLKKEQIKYKILLPGSVPVDPHLQYNANIPHLCTTTLVYKVKDQKILTNSIILCDPAWVNSIQEDLIKQNLKALGLTFDDINYVFVSHEHFDHCSSLHSSSLLDKATMINQDNIKNISGIGIKKTPGHSHDSQTFYFKSNHQKTAIVGDAIINKDYLLNWEIYRPNQYSADAIKQTRKTMKYLIKNFSVIIPGHGAIINVNKELKKKISYKIKHISKI